MRQLAKILIVEDELRMCESLEYLLKTMNYNVTTANCGQDALALIAENAFDLAVLDIHLPDMMGTELMEKIKARSTYTSVIIITGDANIDFALVCLRCGAYDYLRKPFEFEELLARIEALIRRASGHASPSLQCGPVELEPVSVRVTMCGVPVAMTALEYRALKYLMQHQGKVVSKSELSEHIYGQNLERDSNVIEVLVNRLRKKLGNDLIKTHRGLGYQLVVPPSGES